MVDLDDYILLISDDNLSRFLIIACTGVLIIGSKRTEEAVRTDESFQNQKLWIVAAQHSTDFPGSLDIRFVHCFLFSGY